VYTKATRGEKERKKGVQKKKKKEKVYRFSDCGRFLFFFLSCHFAMPLHVQEIIIVVKERSYQDNQEIGTVVSKQAKQASKQIRYKPEKFRPG
jgi:hypothetical protein